MSKSTKSPIMSISSDEFHSLYPLDDIRCVEVKENPSTGFVTRKWVTADGKMWRETWDSDLGTYIYEEIPGCAGGTGMYKRVKLNKKQWYLHDIIAKSFLGEKENNLVIDHLDRDSLNNHINNLRYVTPSENAKNRPERLKGRAISMSILAMHPEQGIAVFPSQQACAEALGIAQCSISLCLNPRYQNKSCKGWSFARGAAV